MFRIAITEVLQRQVEIDAEDEVAAMHIAKEMYRKGEIVLDASDHDATSFSVL